jgi:NAD-dependent deacetylase
MDTIVTFSGAGLSNESGIPTFRDSNGLWHNHKVEDVADHKAWERPDNRQLMLDFYAERFNNIHSVQPNAAHYALAKLEQKYKVINITQNIDDLLERAGCTNVWHLHGSINSRKCEWHKSITNLDGDINFKCDYQTVHTEPVKLGDLCPKCGGQLRPDVVWFGEAVDMKYKELDELAAIAKVFIGIGTSAQVQPAAGLLFTFRVAEKKYFIDLKPPLRLHSFTRLEGKAGDHMPPLAEELLLLAENRT